MAIRDYNSYQRYFDNPYSFSGGRVNSDVSNLLFEAIKRNRNAQLQLNNNRSGLDRTFDLLSTGTYTSAGFVSGMMEDGLGEAFKRAGQGFMAGINVFGEGNQDHEYTYSKVLGQAGWNPESLGGKIAKGAVGFVGDVLLDPTTYLTGGLSAVVKGTGNVGKAGENLSKLVGTLPDLEKANIVDDLVEKGINPDLATRFAERKAGAMRDTLKGADHMTEDMATTIIRRQARERGYKLSDEQIKKDATNFSRKYNQLMGLRAGTGEAGSGITWGVRNLPFIGDKIADKMGVLGNTIKLADDRPVRTLSDKLHISTKYARLRDSIYGTKIGKLFSTNAPLYKLANENPAELYSFVRFADTVRGRNLDKVAADAAIMAKAKEMNFTPEEGKRIIELLEDKTVWGKVRDTLKFAETQKGRTFASTLEESVNKTQEQIDQLIQDRRTLEQMRQATDDELIGERELYESMAQQYRDELSKIDLEAVTNRSQQEELANAIRKEVEDLDRTIARLEEEEALRVQELEQARQIMDANNGARVDKLDELYESAKLEDEALQTHKQQREAFRDMTKVEEQPSAHDGIDSIKSAYADARQRELDQMGDESPRKGAKKNLVDELSQYIFGAKGKILQSTRGQALDDLVNMVKKGESPEAIRYHIETNPAMYSEHAQRVYSLISKELHYSDWVNTKKGERPEWEFVYKKPIQEMREKLQRGEELTPLEMQKFMKLEDLRRERDILFNQYFTKMEYDEFKAVLRDKANLENFGSLAREYNLELKHVRDEFASKGSTARDERYKPDTPILGQMTRGGKTYDIFEVETKVGNKTIPKKRYRIVEKDEDGRDVVRVFRLDRGKMVQVRSDIVSGDAVHQNTRMLSADEEYAEILSDVEMRYINAQSKNASMGNVKKGDKIIKDGRNLQKEENIADAVMRGGHEYITKVSDEIRNVIRKEFSRRDEDGNVIPLQFHELKGWQKETAWRIANKNIKLENIKIVDEETKARIAQEMKRRSRETKIQYTLDNVEEGYTVTIRPEGSRPRAGTVESIRRGEGGTFYSVKVGDETHEVTASDIKSFIAKAKKEQTPEELVENSRVAQKEIEERDALLARLSDAEKGLDEIDAVQREQRAKVLDFFNTRAIEQREVLANLESKMRQFEDTLESMDDATIAKLEDELLQMDDALKSDDALESYARMVMGDDTVDAVLDSVNITNSARIMFDNLDEPDHIKEIAQTLYDAFKKAGEEEVAIGALKKEQFDAMLGRYFPHILSPDGKRFKTKDNELKDFMASLGNNLGYGTKFNNFSISRTTGDHTLAEINEYFRDALKGKNLLSENVADVFVTRMLKHNELMYDDFYMRTMMDMFGTPLSHTRSGVAEGHKAVVNFGELKELVVRLVDSTKNSRRPMSKADVLESLKLPPNILDDGKVPMVELTEEQIAKIAPHGVVKQVNDVIVDKANQARKIQIAKDESRFLGLYDKFLHWTKLMQTVVMPSFHVRNKASNMYQDWLAVGRDAFDPKMMKDSTKASWAMGDREKLRALDPVDVNGTSMGWDELYDLAKANGVIDEGYFAREMRGQDGFKGTFGGKLDPFDTENFALFRAGSAIGVRTENSDRLLQFVSHLKQGKSVDEASEMTNKFLFDYGDLTAFEQNVMKRLFPYYTWLRKNGRLQVSQLIEQPEKLQVMAKINNGINGMTNEEDQIRDDAISPFARDWVQLPITNAFGDPIMMNPNLPFMDLSRLPNPIEGISSTEGAIDEVLNIGSQMAPIPKLAGEFATNTNFFFNDAIVDERDENGITPRLQHIMRQLALYNAGEGMYAKEGERQGLHVLNNLTGLKMLPYNEEEQRGYAMDRLDRAGEQADSIRNAISRFLGRE